MIKGFKCAPDLALRPMFLVDTGYTKPLLVIGGIAFPNDLKEPLRFLCTGVSVHPPNRLFFNARPARD